MLADRLSQSASSCSNFHNFPLLFCGTHRASNHAVGARTGMNVGYDHCVSVCSFVKDELGQLSRRVEFTSESEGTLGQSGPGFPVNLLPGKLQKGFLVYLL